MWLSAGAVRSQGLPPLTGDPAGRHQHRWTAQPGQATLEPDRHRAAGHPHGHLAGVGGDAETTRGQGGGRGGPRPGAAGAGLADPALVDAQVDRPRRGGAR